MSHQPLRFEVYHQLPDGSGFTIPNCNHTFKFDHHKGWFDEQHNYYNADGDPDTPPRSDTSSHSSRHSRHSRHSRNSRHSNPNRKYSNDDDDDFYEDIVNQYRLGNQSDEEDVVYNDEDLRNMEKIEINLETLSNYPFHKALRVFYKNMDAFQTPEAILIAYSKQVGEITKVIPNVGADNKRKSEGYFVMSNRDQASKLIELQGKSIIGRPVYFTVQNIEELLIDPICSIWKTDPQPVQKSKQKPLSHRQQHKYKPTSLQPFQQKKETSKESHKQPEESLKKQSKQQVDPYSFPLPLFSKADEFKEWMKSLGLEFNRDYSDLKKKTINEGQEVYGLIHMTEQMMKRCNGQLFKGKEIRFQKK